MPFQGANERSAVLPLPPRPGKEAADAGSAEARRQADATAREEAEDVLLHVMAAQLQVLRAEVTRQPRDAVFGALPFLIAEAICLALPVLFPGK